MKILPLSKEYTMDHMKLSDELRKQLLESAAWAKADITLRIDETSSEVVEESKGGEDEAAEEAADEAADETEEVVEEEAHVCVLCNSQLDEAIDEERLLEHLDVVMGLVDRLSQLQEGEEDIDEVISQTVSELLLKSEEE
jgi:hypothetical protein